MAECVMPKHAKGLIEKAQLLLSLSQFFAKGGEELQRTLKPLARDSKAFVEQLGIDKLLPAFKILEQYSESGPAEYETMKYEFNRLFVGPIAPKAPPYESVYRSPDRLVMQEQTVAVRKIYVREGLLASSLGHEPDDFVGTELEFMAYLLSQAIHAEDEGNPTHSSYYLDFCQEFCTEHTNQWIQAFANAIDETATHPLFKALSQILVVATQSILQ